MKDKELLIKDLCARLPYETCIDIYGCIVRLVSIDPLISDRSINYAYAIDEVKPYLFPLSSMTEEQREEYNSMVTEELMEIINDEAEIKPEYKYIDWLNEHHFDYRGLIDKSLAIDCTNLNIY